MPPDKIAEIEARLRAASEGPWGFSDVPEFQDMICCTVAAPDTADIICSWPDAEASNKKWLNGNAKFIAHSITDIAALLAEVNRLRTALEEIADHPGPHADEGAWFKTELARAALGMEN